MRSVNMRRLHAGRSTGIRATDSRPYQVLAIRRRKGFMIALVMILTSGLVDEVSAQEVSLLGRFETNVVNFAYQGAC